MINQKNSTESVIVLESDGRTKQGKLAKVSRILTGGGFFKNQAQAVSFLLELK